MTSKKFKTLHHFFTSKGPELNAGKLVFNTYLLTKLKNI